MSTSPPTDPLLQLESFLTLDPDNDALRAEAFELALRGGRQDRAEHHLQAGLHAGRSALAWGLRRAHWLMAGRDWASARAQLEALRQRADAPPALIECALHDDAYIAFCEAEPQRGIDLLEPVVEAGPPSPSIQVLWLRLLHRVDRLDRAMQSAQAWASAEVLDPVAAGVASLVALDSGDLDTCRVWADAALAQGVGQVEALVARASIALADQAPQQARAVLAVAMARNPNDGRTLSALAFTELLEGDLAEAQQQFRRALQLMPAHIGTWHGLAWCALLQRDLHIAGEAFKKGLDLDRNFAESHGGMAVVHAMSGARAAAEAAIDRAMRLDRKSMSAHYAQAVLDGRAGDAPAMQRLAQALLSVRRT